MSTHHANPLDHAEIRQGTVLRYIVAFIISALCMGAAMLAVQLKLPFLHYAALVVALTLIALLSQAALFFGLDISRAQIWKSVSLVLTVPLFIISVGLTVWAFSSLYERTMLPPSGVTQPGMSAPAVPGMGPMGAPSQPTLLQ